MGTTRHDETYVLGEFFLTFFKENQLIHDTELLAHSFVSQTLESLGIPYDYGVYDTIAKMYLGNSRKSGDFGRMFPGLVDLFSAFFFKAPSYQTALLHSKLNNNTYWDSSDFQGRQTLWKRLFPHDAPPFRGGIAHGDDLTYLFQITGYGYDEQECAVSNRMIDYWANFVTTGNPTPRDETSDMITWPHLSVSEEKFMNIGKDSTEQAHFYETWSGPGLEL